LAPDSLHMLDLSNGENNCKWITIPCSGNSPGKRYGHTMCYMKPYLMTFGGNVGNRITNDIHLINVDDGIFEWKKLETQGEVPCSRMYHASSVCKYGGASGMMIVYGGRGESSNALCDTWGLRKHRNGSWDWLKAPYSNNYLPLKRYQHSMAFYYNFMIVLGGRTDDDLKNIPIEIYDTESSEWLELAFFNKFRHSSWIVDNSLYTHGGFDYVSPMISKNDLVMIDIIKLMNTNGSLSKKLDKLNDIINKSSSKNKEIVNNTNNNNLNISTGSATPSQRSQNASKNPTPNISPSNVNNNNQIMQNHSLGKYANGNPANSNAEAQLNLFNKINLNGKKKKLFYFKLYNKY
jgi:protein phosphatase